MAIPRIKATYSLDPETVELLSRLARRWRVPKSEALRRAIHTSASMPGEIDDRTAALDRVQGEAALDAKRAKAWAGSVRAERRRMHAKRPGLS